MYSRKRTYGGMSGGSYGEGGQYTRRLSSGKSLVVYPKGIRGGGFKRARLAGPITVAVRNRYPKLATRGWNNNNAELKYNDLSSASYVADTTGTVTALNLTAVGDDNTTRDGRQICNKSIHVQGVILPVDVTAILNSYCRMMLVWDSQPNSGTIAAITDILVASTSLSNTNLNNRERFTILRDCRYSLGAIVTTATQAITVTPGVQVVNEFVNLKDVKTTYSGTTAAIGSVATGALLMVTIGNQAAGDCGRFDLTTRLRFTDR